MNRDPFEERTQQLFEAARKEAPSEDTRQRILLALREEAPHRVLTRAAWISPRRLSIGFLAAACAFGGLFIALRASAPEIPDIAAERIAIRPPKKGTSGEDTGDATSSKERKAASNSTKSEESKAQTSSPATAPKKIAPPSLEQELSAMQSARATLDRGDPAATLARLDGFGRSPGWRELSVEASLLRIEALAQLGKSDEARTQAKRFVEENPNNPLVDRAEKFTHAPAGPEGDAAANSEGE